MSIKHEILVYQVQNCTSLNDKIFKAYLVPVSTSKKIIHLPGQYCELLCADNKFRPFSITNCPDADYGIELHIRISYYNSSMRRVIETGQLVKLKGPYGKCIYCFSSENPTLFLAEGLGITAFYPIIKNNQFSANNCLLVWINHEIDHLYAINQINEWMKKIAGFKVHIIERSDTAYHQVLHYCRHCIAADKKTRLYLAGSPLLKDFMIHHFISQNKDAIDFFCDV